MDVMTSQMGDLDLQEYAQTVMRTMVVARRGNPLIVICIYRPMATPRFGGCAVRLCFSNGVTVVTEVTLLASLDPDTHPVGLAPLAFPWSCVKGCNEGAPPRRALYSKRSCIFQ